MNRSAVAAALLLALPATSRATPLEDIREDKQAICQQLRHRHPTVAAILVAIGNRENIVLSCHAEGDRAYAPLVLVFPSAAVVLRLKDDG